MPESSYRRFSIVVSSGKRYYPKVLWKASGLPFAFLGGGYVRVGGGDSVRSGVTGVTDHVGCSSGVTSGTGGGTGRTFICIASGGVGGDCGGTCLAHPYFAPRPCSRRLDSFPRAVIARILLLEMREYVLGAVGGPERQRSLVFFVEPHFFSSFGASIKFRATKAFAPSHDAYSPISLW
jgi:hypothetical protein